MTSTALPSAEPYRTTGISNSGGESFLKDVIRPLVGLISGDDNHYPARTCTPFRGMFIQTDPLIRSERWLKFYLSHFTIAPKHDVDQAVYEMCRSNPTILVDPLGTNPLIAGGAAIVAAGCLLCASYFLDDVTTNCPSSIPMAQDCYVACKTATWCTVGCEIIRFVAEEEIEESIEAWNKAAKGKSPLQRPLPNPTIKTLFKALSSVQGIGCTPKWTSCSCCCGL